MGVVMKFCQKCGNQIDNNAQFCPVCGTPQQQITNNPQGQYKYSPQNQNVVYVQPQQLEKKKAGCGTILLWIFFCPIMLWVHAFRKKQIGWFLLAVIVTSLFFGVFIGYNGNGAKYTKAPLTKPHPSLYKIVDYEDCARYPERYKGGKALLEGNVIQVIGSRDKGFTIRLATSGSFDDIYYLSVNFDPGFNILENDKLTVYAELTGTQSYQAIFGNTITIPSARADWVELYNSKIVTTPVSTYSENDNYNDDFYIFATSVSNNFNSTKEPDLLISPKK